MVDVSEVVLALVEGEDFGDGDCGLDAHFYGVAVAWTAWRLWLENVFGHPRAVGVDDALVVVHALRRSAMLCGLYVVRSGKLTGVGELVARLVYLVGRGRFAIATVDWLSSRIAGQRCPYSVLAEQPLSIWMSRILVC